MQITTTNNPTLLHNHVIQPITALELLDIRPSSSNSHDLHEQPAPEVAEASTVAISKGRTVLVIATLTGVTFANSMSTGLLTVGLPRIAMDLGLSENLLLWPASVYALTSGCSLILAGSIADLVGNRIIFLVGCFLLGMFNLACGLARTGIQLIIFRAFQGIALSFCLPTTVSIITDGFPSGKRRNVGFACLGLGQPLGFAVGLVLGGFFVDSVGWRSAYYLCAAANIMVLVAGIWDLPRDRPREPLCWNRLGNQIDWVGATLASSCLGILSYILAVVTTTAAPLRDASSIALLSISIAMIPAFVFWMSRQERLAKPALIPNSMWKNTSFTAVCLMVLLTWAVLQTMDWFLSLFFQKVQGLSAIQSSLRFIPNVIIGVILNVAIGLTVHKFPANYLVLITSLISAGSPLLMALVNPQWPYWYAAFWAVLIGPLSVDVLFTVSNLVITDVFPEEAHALAGAVFNTVAQFGTSVGLAIMAIISSSVTSHSPYLVKESPKALMQGYRATFWASFGCMVLAFAIGLLGLRTIGKVGLKRE